MEPVVRLALDSCAQPFNSSPYGFPQLQEAPHHLQTTIRVDVERMEGGIWCTCWGYCISPEFAPLFEIVGS